MASARGDRKPCTRAECSGTMQFGREPKLPVSFAMTADGGRGWVCSENPAHFQLASERPWQVTAARPAPHAPQYDAGGSTPGEHTIGSRLQTAQALTIWWRVGNRECYG
jgi:hypothetical protein